MGTTRTRNAFVFFSNVVVAIGELLYAFVIVVASLFCVNVRLRLQVAVNVDEPSPGARSAAGRTNNGSTVAEVAIAAGTLPLPVPTKGVYGFATPPMVALSVADESVIVPLHVLGRVK